MKQQTQLELGVFAAALPAEAVAPVQPAPPPIDETDEVLFASFAQDGCERAFEIIFQRYRPRIRGFILRRIGDEAQADDLTQNVFVRIIRNKKNFDPTKNFSTWSHTIANNCLKNHYRSASRNRMQCFSDLKPRLATKSRATDADPVFDAPATTATPDVHAFRRELRERVLEALEMLPPPLRDPFILHQIEGLSYDMVAQELTARNRARFDAGEIKTEQDIQVPVGTVKSRTHKAREHLRTELADFSLRDLNILTESEQD